MEERDTLHTRGRALEEEYFHRREKELIEKLRRRAEDAAGRQQLAERTGVADQEILQDLLDLGYTADTVMLLHLVPLVQMAWAEGSVSSSERRLIVKAARARGVSEGSGADRQLGQWLDRRPSQEFFAQTLRAVSAMLEAQPAEAREASHRDLLSYCTAIASASGGVLGFGSVSEDERRILAEISGALEGRRPGNEGSAG